MLFVVQKPSMENKLMDNSLTTTNRKKGSQVFLFSTRIHEFKASL